MAGKVYLGQECGAGRAGDEKLIVGAGMTHRSAPAIDRQHAAGPGSGGESYYSLSRVSRESERGTCSKRQSADAGRVIVGVEGAASEGERTAAAAQRVVRSQRNRPGAKRGAAGVSAGHVQVERAEAIFDHRHVGAAG